ncbi:MAG: ABC transporter ATP-binding protein [Bacilli bacterium]
MLKLFKRFRTRDWLFVLILCGFVVGQVYFDVTLPTYTAKTFNAMKNFSTIGEILSIGLTMLLFSIGSMACSIVVSYIATSLAVKFSARLRRSLFSKVQSFSFEETGKFSTASLLTRSTNDIQQVQMAIMMILRMAISAPLTAVWAIVKINASSSELTIASSLWIVILVTLLTTIFLLVLPKFKIVQKLTDKLNGVTRENMLGLRVVKAYNADTYQEKKFDTVNTDLTKTNLFVNRIMGLMQPAMMLVMNGITLTIYWLGASLLNSNTSNLDYPTMMAFSMLVMQVLMAFMILTMLFIMVPRASVSAKRINEVLQTPLSIMDPLNGSEEFKTQGEIEFKNVCFKYPGAEQCILQNISFKVKKGQTVAVIGSTGSGKSTLINLVPRFFDATEGEVLVDGVNVKNVTQENLRKRIGYIPQKGILFSGSVSDNIGYGVLSLSLDKMTEVASVAMADEFIINMEGGYNAEIAQGGKNVSGGQRQRLSIARAVAISPEIYIFDDSFSALDYTTDKAVRENLKHYTKTATSLIVAQRIGTILDADMIIVLEQGKIVGSGTHQELLHSCEVYREIALSQLSLEELGI